MYASLCSLLMVEAPHQFILGLATLWVFSAAVSAMAAPDVNTSQGYQWLYRFTHLLAANLDRAGLLSGLEETEALQDHPKDLRS